MNALSHVIENQRDDLERIHGPEVLPSHRQVLRAMLRCRRQDSNLMVLEYSDCTSNLKFPSPVATAAARIASTMKATNRWRSNGPNCIRPYISWSPSRCQRSEYAYSEPSKEHPMISRRTSYDL